MMSEQRGVMKPYGPAAAFLIAAGIGTLFLGVITTMSEVSASFAKSITYSSAVGPLSGKTIWASVVYVVAAAILAAVMWRRSPSRVIVYWVTGLLIGLGLILTFPPTWKLFGAG